MAEFFSEERLFEFFPMAESTFGARVLIIFHCLYRAYNHISWIISIRFAISSWWACPFAGFHFHIEVWSSCFACHTRWSNSIYWVNASVDLVILPFAGSIYNARSTVTVFSASRMYISKFNWFSWKWSHISHARSSCWAWPFAGILSHIEVWNIIIFASHARWSNSLYCASVNLMWAIVLAFF